MASRHVDGRTVLRHVEVMVAAVACGAVPRAWGRSRVTSRTPCDAWHGREPDRQPRSAQAAHRALAEYPVFALASPRSNFLCDQCFSHAHASESVVFRTARRKGLARS